jgi:tRNA (cmo5U34)-methyltransferase
MDTLNGFNRVSAWYDRLARLIFANSIYNAQVTFLCHIAPKSKVLILGGGTGSLLAELLRINSTCEVWYIEASSRMISLAKAQAAKSASANVHFINGTQDGIPTNIAFDVVITPFFLDLFSATRLRMVIQNVSAALTPQGLWLATDFVNTGKWQHRLLLKTMYAFFRITAGIEARTLPDWERMLLETGAQLRDSAFFFNGFIKSAVYDRRGQ